MSYKDMEKYIQSYDDVFETPLTEEEKSKHRKMVESEDKRNYQKGITDPQEYDDKKAELELLKELDPDRLKED